MLPELNFIATISIINMCRDIGGFASPKSIAIIRYQLATDESQQIMHIWQTPISTFRSKMTFNHESFVNLIEEFNTKSDIQPILSQIKSSNECKQKILFDISTYHGQQYCQILTENLSKRVCQELEESDVIITLCDAFLQQVTFVNIRWYLLDQCHILDILAKQFLSSTNQSVQIKIAKTIQTFLIYSQDDEGKSSIDQDLVSQLFKCLVAILQSNYSQDYNEASLGLLASLCQIWANCQQMLNVIDDYQVLRKQLLRFLSAERVKRTTIVYTMTIMFHLCNSDDRLFNKRNIRQTLQVLFNIMLNGDTEWAPLYAVRLLMEICNSSRTCHLLTEYRSLSTSLKDTIVQINGKEKIVTVKHLEFILIIISVNPEYRRIVMEIMISGNKDLETGWDNSTNDVSNNNDAMVTLIKLINDSDNTIVTHALRLLDEIYLELLSSSDVSKIPLLTTLSEAIQQSLSSATCKNFSMGPYQLSENLNHPSVAKINQQITNHIQLSNMTKIKSIIQLMTTLITYGDQWLDQVSSFLNNTDRLIREQIDSSPLNDDVSLLDHDLASDVSSLGVEIFIDTLYFYYKATEIRISSSMFGERLKTHLEHKKCPILLAFALSAATHNQTILQRALVLQGVCLHLQDFNVELMGEKMYQFSSEFAAMKFQFPMPNKPPAVAKIVKLNIDSEIVSKVAEGDILYPVDTNYNSLSATNSKQIICQTSLLNLENSSIHNPKTTSTINQNSAEIDITQSDHFPTKGTSIKISETMNSNYGGDQNDKMNLELKVQQIVKKWIEIPETNFSSNEVYSIFEYRIQSMQNQEALMEEIIANKTAALYQSEALLTQYRNKLSAAEKESKQLRSIQVDTMSKLDAITKTCDNQQERLIELEKINYSLADSNRNSDKNKEECLTISKKLQERLLKVSEEKSKLQSSLEGRISQVDDLQKIISQKDVQIANYTQVTKLINKLTGNKFPATDTNNTFNLEELAKSISSPTRSDYDCYANTNNNSEQVTDYPPVSSSTDDCNSHLCKPTLSITDFLQVYKNNSRFLQNHK